MKAKAKYLSVATAALFIGMSALTSFAGPSTGAYVPLQTPEQAKDLPDKAKIMLACSGCKTIRPLNKKGIMAWFSTKVQHDCPACGGKLTFTGATPGKSAGSPTEYVHTCSHCGNVSAYVCASH
jgi:predicted RNA-binding Zn-ribbon protein involved in translation (DUF1610 family)